MSYTKIIKNIGKEFNKSFNVEIDFREKPDNEIKEVIKELKKIDNEYCLSWIEDLIEIIENK